MKRFLVAAVSVLLSTPVLAADMEVKALPAPLPTSIWTWTGFYLGGDIGGVWSSDKVSPTIADGGPFPRQNTLSTSGVFGGGTIGYNYQINVFLLGLEGDIGYMGVGGSRIDVPGFAESDHLSSDWYGDITARLGLVFGQTLIYGKGGYAFFNGNANTTTTIAGFTSTSTGSFSGWTAGGGVEYKLTPSWTAKVEYLHFDFGTQTAVVNPGSFGSTNRLTMDTVKVGINYLFNMPTGPVVAKY